MSDSKIPDFTYAKHKALLPEWVKEVFAQHKPSKTTAANQLQAWIAGQDIKWPPNLKRRGVSKNTLERLQQPNYKMHTFMMGVIWNYLRANYPGAYPGEEIPAQEIPPPPQLQPLLEEPNLALAIVLEKFLREGTEFVHKWPLKKIKKTITGSFVMYRPDLEPAARESLEKDGVRVSIVNITDNDAGLMIEEIQDFPDRDPAKQYHQVNSGVLVPYGDFLIALMNGNKDMSFKCMVIEKIVPSFNGTGTDDFSGKILVSSWRASFPTVNFVCQLRTGKERLGIDNTFSTIPEDIAFRLKKPPFYPLTYPIPGYTAESVAASLLANAAPRPAYSGINIAGYWTVELEHYRAITLEIQQEHEALHGISTHVKKRETDPGDPIRTYNLEGRIYNRFVLLNGTSQNPQRMAINSFLLEIRSDGQTMHGCVTAYDPRDEKIFSVKCECRRVQ
jgi:hypothetical protein